MGKWTVPVNYFPFFLSLILGIRDRDGLGKDEIVDFVYNFYREHFAHLVCSQLKNNWQLYVNPQFSNLHSRIIVRHLVHFTSFGMFSTSLG